MKIDSYKTKGLFRNIRSLYRFQIIDTNTYDVKWVIEMSKLNLLILFGICFVLLLVLAFSVFALTPLRYLLPDYIGANAEEKREMIELKLKAEDLEEKIRQYGQYYTNLQTLMEDSVVYHADYLKRNDSLTVSERESKFPSPGQLESQYRKDFETLLKMDKTYEKAGKLFILNEMQLPAEGKPVHLEGSDLHSKTLKIKSKPEAGINSVLSGIVIARYIIGSRTHLLIQHESGLLSSYKFEGKAEVSQSEKVFAGQLIGIMSNQGDDILSFDLWSDTEPIATGQYLKY